MADHVTILEKVTFDADGARTWLRSLDDGKTWERIDCSMYPDGRPPFVLFNRIDSKTGTMVDKEVTS